MIGYCLYEEAGADRRRLVKYSQKNIVLRTEVVPVLNVDVTGS